MEERRPQPGERYRHFKNKLYQIITIAVHSETKEELVIYQALYEDFAVYATPLAMFVSEVDHKKYPDVQQKYRFEKAECATKVDHSEEEKPSGTRNLFIEVSKEPTFASNQKVERENVLPDKTKILLEFLDCESYDKKLEYLRDTKKYMDDKMINDISFALDIVIEEGELEERIRSLENCLKTFRKYECNRLR